MKVGTVIPEQLTLLEHAEIANHIYAMFGHLEGISRIADGKVSFHTSIALGNLWTWLILFRERQHARCVINRMTGEPEECNPLI